MAWLLRRGEVLASLELVHSPIARVRGYVGRDHEHGALLFAPCRLAHSIGSHAPLDVAYLDDEYVVVALTRLRVNRIARPRRGCSSVLEVEAGAFDRWGLRLGDTLEITS